MQRWVGSEHRRRFVPALLALVMYATYMGAVDRIDKTVVYANIRVGHCAQRYHRVIFFWHVATRPFGDAQSASKVNLCSELCFAAFDHVHRCQRRELVVQYARVAPGSEVGPDTEPACPACDSPSGPSTGGGEPRRRGRSGGEKVVEGRDFGWKPRGAGEPHRPQVRYRWKGLVK